MTVGYGGDGLNEPQWWPSRYGPDDRTGAVNEITSERMLAALRIPKRGKAIRLALPLTENVPTMGPRRWSKVILMHESTSRYIASTETHETSLEEHVSGGYHIGCHVDALGHLGIDGRFYNGLQLGDFATPTGLIQLGIEMAGPWVTRGVCLDIPAAVGVELGPGFVIEPPHLEAACERQGVTVGPGDAMLIHTGWSQYWTDDPERYGHAEPGLGFSGAQWLTSRRVSLVGADNWGIDVVPFERPGFEYPVHQHLLAETGTHILENADTRELADGEHSEFLFVLSLPNVPGATAAPAGPLAVI